MQLPRTWSAIALAVSAVSLRTTLGESIVAIIAHAGENTSKNAHYLLQLPISDTPFSFLSVRRPQTESVISSSEHEPTGERPQWEYGVLEPGALSVGNSHQTISSVSNNPNQPTGSQHLHRYHHRSNDASQPASSDMSATRFAGSEFYDSNDGRYPGRGSNTGSLTATGLDEPLIFAKATNSGNNNKPVYMSTATSHTDGFTSHQKNAPHLHSSRYADISHNNLDMEVLNSPQELGYSNDHRNEDGIGLAGDSIPLMGMQHAPTQDRTVSSNNQLARGSPVADNLLQEIAENENQISQVAASELVNGYYSPTSNAKPLIGATADITPLEASDSLQSGFHMSEPLYADAPGFRGHPISNAMLGMSGQVNDFENAKSLPYGVNAGQSLDSRYADVARRPSAPISHSIQQDVRETEHRSSFPMNISAGGSAVNGSDPMSAPAPSLSASTHHHQRDKQQSNSRNHGPSLNASSRQPHNEESGDYSSFSGLTPTNNIGAHGASHQASVPSPLSAANQKSSHGHNRSSSHNSGVQKAHSKAPYDPVEYDSQPHVHSSQNLSYRGYPEGSTLGPSELSAARHENSSWFDPAADPPVPRGSAMGVAHSLSDEDWGYPTGTGEWIPSRSTVNRIPNYYSEQNPEMGLVTASHIRHPEDADDRFLNYRPSPGAEHYNRPRNPYNDDNSGIMNQGFHNSINTSPNSSNHLLMQKESHAGTPLSQSIRDGITGSTPDGHLQPQLPTSNNHPREDIVPMNPFAREDMRTTMYDTTDGSARNSKGFISDSSNTPFNNGAPTAGSNLDGMGTHVPPGSRNTSGEGRPPLLASLNSPNLISGEPPACTSSATQTDGTTHGAQRTSGSPSSATPAQVTADKPQGTPANPSSEDAIDGHPPIAARSLIPPGGSDDSSPPENDEIPSRKPSVRSSFAGNQQAGADDIGNERSAPISQRYSQASETPANVTYYIENVAPALQSITNDECCDDEIDCCDDDVPTNKISNDDAGTTNEHYINLR